jgi:hypothetical protein
LPGLLRLDDGRTSLAAFLRAGALRAAAAFFTGGLRAGTFRVAVLDFASGFLAGVFFAAGRFLTAALLAGAVFAAAVFFTAGFFACTFLVVAGPPLPARFVAASPADALPGALPGFVFFTAGAFPAFRGAALTSVALAACRLPVPVFACTAFAAGLSAVAPRALAFLLADVPAPDGTF